VEGQSVVDAIFDVFRVEAGEFLEEAELIIYARHIQDLIAYLENIVLLSEQDLSVRQSLFAVAQEIGYQAVIRQMPLEMLQQVGERLRQELTEIVLHTLFPQLETKDMQRRLMDVSMLIADYTLQLVIGFNQCNNEERVRQTEWKYNLVLDTLPVTVVVYDHEERCVFANKTCYESVNRKAEEIIGKKRLELSGKYHDSKEPEDAWERVLAGEHVKFRLEYFSEDGLTHNDKEMIPLTDATGKVNSIITVSYPAVSEKERLYNLQKQFSFVLNSMSSGLLILNRELVVTGFNKKAESIFDMEADCVLGKCLAELYQKHVGENQTAFETLLTVVEDGTPIREWEHQLTVDERSLTLRLDGNPIKNAHGAVVGYILIIDDLTELQAMREAMMRNEKFALIGQFAAGIAHEIRNPLTTVYGFLQLFSKRSVQPENFLDLTEKLLLPEIDRANTILSDFLMVSKPQAPTRALVDTGTFFADVVRLVESEAHLRGVLLKVEIPEELPRLQLDVQQMKQVFLNLCKNGFDVTPPSGTMTLRVEVEQQAVRFDVIDEGPGIQVHDISRIFEPFFTTKAHGTGLGLPISHRIIEGHGGDLQVRSHEGVGTKFTITIPFPCV
jgi:two-component system, sporulation sensor kinase E